MAQVFKFFATFVPLLLGFATAINSLFPADLAWASRWGLVWWLTLARTIQHVAFLCPYYVVALGAYPLITHHQLITTTATTRWGSWWLTLENLLLCSILGETPVAHGDSTYEPTGPHTHRAAAPCTFPRPHSADLVHRVWSGTATPSVDKYSCSVPVH